MAQFEYFGTTLANQNLIQEEIKRRLISGTACYHSVQKLLSSRETWFLTLREEHRLRVFENRVLRRIFG
jgi:hypothetical protein